MVHCSHCLKDERKYVRRNSVLCSAKIFSFVNLAFHRQRRTDATNGSDAIIDILKIDLLDISFSKRIIILSTLFLFFLKKIFIIWNLAFHCGHSTGIVIGIFLRRRIWRRRILADDSMNQRKETNTLFVIAFLKTLEWVV